jgi:hypothetical protein
MSKGSTWYRITMSPHEWTWTQSEQEEMAKHVLDLIEERKVLIDSVRFYANTDNWNEGDMELGYRARSALESLSLTGYEADDALTEIRKVFE